METIIIQILQPDVYDEVAKATDYTGSKLVDGDDTARDRILATDDNLADLERFWEECVLAANENLKEMLVRGGTTRIAGAEGYEAEIEVSKSFDKTLRESVQTALRGFFIVSMVGQWFKYVNKGEAADYFAQGAEMMATAERLLYSRKRPALPTD